MEQQIVGNCRVFPLDWPQSRREPGSRRGAGRCGDHATRVVGKHHQGPGGISKDKRLIRRHDPDLPQTQPQRPTQCCPIQSNLARTVDHPRVSKRSRPALPGFREGSNHHLFVSLEGDRPTRGARRNSVHQGGQKRGHIRLGQRHGHGTMFPGNAPGHIGVSTGRIDRQPHGPGSCRHNQVQFGAPHRHRGVGGPLRTAEQGQGGNEQVLLERELEPRPDQGLLAVGTDHFSGCSPDLDPMKSKPGRVGRGRPAALVQRSQEFHRQRDGLRGSSGKNRSVRTRTQGFLCRFRDLQCQDHTVASRQQRHAISRTANHPDINGVPGSRARSREPTSHPLDSTDRLGWGWNHAHLRDQRETRTVTHARSGY